MLTIVDTFSRFSPALEPRFTFHGADVVEVLERVGRQVGFPATIRVDQGTEFVSRDLDLWAYQRGVTSRFQRFAHQAVAHVRQVERVCRSDIARVTSSLGKR